MEFGVRREGCWMDSITATPSAPKTVAEHANAVGLCFKIQNGSSRHQRLRTRPIAMMRGRAAVAFTCKRIYSTYPIRSEFHTISALACCELQIHLSSPVLVIESCCDHNVNESKRLKRCKVLQALVLSVKLSIPKSRKSESDMRSNLCLPQHLSRF